ncbi:hypothetical protein APY04_0181 [Hyphomicrobium sulfonivorans]|uniref:Uncharacterized protein n=1 Tax=Hyphomicrobium sulfonivorans TaxID=121290 RepID=A0A120CYE2_HYPSL|nr:hypothetical protein [Hyphomicrobium sulfonivorans]KWT72387.1 hypothetical protein APY04_0181 [Hyphomicrobium sulfonivorans]
MIEIVAIVCLALQPTACQPATLVAPALISPTQCFRDARVEAVKWSLRHPEWRVTQWKCQYAGKIMGA